jgi:1,4-dihydroxy-2-naphthoate octaprenyltransferase
MSIKLPEIIKMIRAQFLIGIVFPLVVGTLTAMSISGSFHVPGFFLVMLMGIGLHLATDVYNDIYDTKQGADTKETNDVIRIVAAQGFSWKNHF